MSIDSFVVQNGKGTSFRVAFCWISAKVVFVSIAFVFTKASKTFSN